MNRRRSAPAHVDRAGGPGALLTISEVARALRVSRRAAIGMIVRNELLWVRRMGRTVVPARAVRVLGAPTPPRGVASAR